MNNLLCGIWQTAQEDIDTERAAYHMSRQGLDTMYQDIQQRLQIEINNRMVIEQLILCDLCLLSFLFII